jgi:hypothetical protein
MKVERERVAVTVEIAQQWTDVSSALRIAWKYPIPEIGYMGPVVGGA